MEKQDPQISLPPREPFVTPSRSIRYATITSQFSMSMLCPEIKSKSEYIKSEFRTLQHILSGRIHTACSVFHNQATGGICPDYKT